MEELLLDIIAAIRKRGDAVPGDELADMILAHIKRTGAVRSECSKRRLLPFYLRLKREDPKRWGRLGIAPEEEPLLIRTLRVKPRRTASGVATISVITRPGPCSGDCLFCPCDVRMPKSYLHAEPACARAEQNFFDPYLQVASRLRALVEMGHATDKVELIVLGGTWTDYPEGYQVWFVRELFRALNDAGADSAAAAAEERRRRAFYENLGIACDEEGVAVRASAEQHLVDAGKSTFNGAMARLYGSGSVWERAAAGQVAAWGELEREQRRNEDARHRVVGLVVETRPDAVTPVSLERMRRLGCTKVQIGVQSTDRELLARNGRSVREGAVERAFALLRLYGFKVHAHFMLNLLGATPEGDKKDYLRFAGPGPYQPDEVKLYPCSLVAGTGLVRAYESSDWRPYSEGELLDVLSADVMATPPFTRISRMIRDISAQDILVGNKKANLRQMVDAELARRCLAPTEIRAREIGLDAVDASALSLDVVAYATGATEERFLQWVTPEGRIAGFLRLSLPHTEALRDLALACRDAGVEAPVRAGEAMIREVHVYGSAERLGESGEGAQHLGLGRALVDRACAIAREEGFSAVNVISAVGTRAYYRRLGFADAGLYQRKELTGACG